jgi:GT2 family glycosyltransferase
VLPAWLAALAGQARRPDQTLLLINDSSDQSWAIANGPWWTCMSVPRVDPFLWTVHAERYDTGHPHYERGSGYTVDHHANLASVRNRWIERALAQWPQATHLWMVDSDVLPEPDCLALLLAADKDVVAAPVRNGEKAWNFMSGYRHHEGSVEPVRMPGEAEMLAAGALPFEVALLGACTLVRRAVLDTWIGVDPAVGVNTPHQPPQPLVRFAPHPRGEDLAFCAAARAAGYQLFVEPRARTAHWMDPDKEPLR